MPASDGIPETDEIAREIALDVWALPRPLTRADYERACRAYGLTPRLDDELSQYGDFRYPEYPLGDLPRRLIDQWRGLAAQREQEIAADLAREAAQAEALRRREMAIADLRARPVARVYETLGVLGTPSGTEWLRKGRLHTVVAREPGPRIAEDDPSVYGPHLLGCEGEQGVWLTVEVREAP